MLSRLSLLAALLLAPAHLLLAQDTVLVAPAPAPTLTPPAPPPADSVRCGFCHHGGVLMAAVSGVVSNVILNRFNAWALHDTTAYVSPRTWRNNLRQGWDWDTDDFLVNMFGHPYMGSGYYRSARTEGLGMPLSATITAVHAISWEYFGETTQPSINDAVNTTLGGIAVGEMFYRIAATIRNNEVRGRTRILRELAALPFDPGGTLIRLLRGEWTRQGPNPEEHHPRATTFRIGGGAGLVHGSDATGFKLAGARGSSILTADLKYGDAYTDTLRKPFDAFTMRIMFAPGHGGLTQLVGVGRIAGTQIGSERVPAQLELNQRFEYVNGGSLRFGGQTFQLAVTTRPHLVGRFWFRGLIGADAIVLAGINGPGAGTGPRDYDFGPGIGATFSASIEHNTSSYLTARFQPAYTHTISGGAADHVTSFASLEADLPLVHQFSLAIHWSYYTRTSRYADGTRASAYFPELRIFLEYKVVR